MKYTVYSFLFFIISTIGFAQYSLEGSIKFEDEDKLKSSIKVYDKTAGFVDEVYEGEIFILENKVQKVTYIFNACPRNQNRGFILVVYRVMEWYKKKIHRVPNVIKEIALWNYNN